MTVCLVRLAKPVAEIQFGEAVFLNIALGSEAWEDLFNCGEVQLPIRSRCVEILRGHAVTIEEVEGS